MVTRKGTRVSGWPISLKRDLDSAVAPDRVAADAGPLRGKKPGDKFGEVAFIRDTAREAADFMHLAGARTPPRNVAPNEIGTRASNARCTLRYGAKINRKRAVAVKCAKGCNAIPHARKQHAEWDAEPGISFEFERTREDY